MNTYLEKVLEKIDKSLSIEEMIKIGLKELSKKWKEKLDVRSNNIWITTYR